MPTHLQRETPIVDFGAHIVPEEYVPDSMQRLDSIIGPIHNDPDLIHARYTEVGIDRIVLSQPPYMGHGDANSVAKSNDGLCDIINDHDDFYGLAAIPTAAGGEIAANEFERCLNNGLHGGALETMSDGIELIDNEVEPIFRVAEKYDAPILVHPKIHMSLHDEVDVLSDKYQLNATLGREVALSESIFKLIHGGVLETFPDLNLVFHHLGGNIASMLGRIHVYHDIERWPGQEEIKSFTEFKRELENRIYLDSSGFWGYPGPIRTTLEEFPASQVLLGTDSPYEPRSADELHQYVKSIIDVTSETDADSVLGENALDLLANVS
ncbi:MAG: amidohydrolase family protein [Halobacteriaceae archaeon]